MGNVHESKPTRAAPKPTAEPAPQAHTPGAVPAPAQVDTMLQARGIAFRDTIDFGSKLVGKTYFLDVPVFNLDPMQAATASVHIAETPELKLADGADIALRPSKEGPNPADRVQLGFAPEKPGHFKTDLEVAVKWAGPRAAETFVASVRGEAFEEGQHEKEEYAHRQQDEANADRSRRAEADRMAALHERRMMDNTQHPVLTTTAADEYFNLRGEFKGRIESLFRGRMIGINGAEMAASGYSRPIPPKAQLRAELAAFGIMAATGAIAAIVTAGTSAILTELGAAAVARVVGGLVGAQVTKAGAGLVPAAPAAGTDHGVPTVDFFQQQRTLLNDAETSRDTAVADLHAVMFPLLVENPTLAARAMKALVDAISPMSSPAMNAQRLESEKVWARYVSHTSLGDDATDHTIANIDRANAAPDARGPVNSFDGLIELRFSGDYNDPQRPVRLVDAWINGLTSAIVERYRTGSVLDSEIPVRATGIPDAVNAEFPVTVVKNERGRVAYRDDFGTSIEPSHWLSNKRHGDAESGAKILLEELAREPLGEKLRAK